MIKVLEKGSHCSIDTAELDQKVVPVQELYLFKCYEQRTLSVIIFGDNRTSIFETIIACEVERSICEQCPQIEKENIKLTNVKLKEFIIWPSRWLSQRSLENGNRTFSLGVGPSGMTKKQRKSIIKRHRETFFKRKLLINDIKDYI